LNSQAEVLKESVAQLAHLVGGKSAALDNEADIPVSVSKKVQGGRASAKRGTPSRGKFDGRANDQVNDRRAPAATVSRRRLAELPMGGRSYRFLMGLHTSRGNTWLPRAMTSHMAPEYSIRSDLANSSDSTPLFAPS
jgi:hypothetical protein